MSNLSPARKTTTIERDFDRCLNEEISNQMVWNLLLGANVNLGSFNTSIKLKRAGYVFYSWRVFHDELKGGENK
jgi:hypothetical protein